MLLDVQKRAYGRSILLAVLCHRCNPIRYPFVPGDTICYRGSSGTFLCYQPHHFVELAADVLLPGRAGPYEYPAIAVRVTDLTLIKRRVIDPTIVSLIDKEIGTLLY